MQHSNLLNHTETENLLLLQLNLNKVVNVLVYIPSPIILYLALLIHSLLSF